MATIGLPSRRTVIGAGLAASGLVGCGVGAFHYTYPYRLTVTVDAEGRRYETVSGAVLRKYADPPALSGATAGVHVDILSGAGGVVAAGDGHWLLTTLTSYWPVDKLGARQISQNAWDPASLVQARLGLPDRWEDKVHNSGLAELMRRAPGLSLELTPEDLPPVVSIAEPRDLAAMTLVDPAKSASSRGVRIIGGRLEFKTPALDYAAVKTLLPWLALRRAGSIARGYEPTTPRFLLKESFYVEPA